MTSITCKVSLSTLLAPSCITQCTPCEHTVAKAHGSPTALSGTGFTRVRLLYHITFYPSLLKLMCFRARCWHNRSRNTTLQGTQVHMTHLHSSASGTSWQNFSRGSCGYSSYNKQFAMCFIQTAVRTQAYGNSISNIQHHRQHQTVMDRHVIQPGMVAVYLAYMYTRSGMIFNC
jgi:hypothetical protein